MEYISSDTSVWIDFSLIRRTALPFRLPYVYIMNNDAIENELLSPSGLREELVENGLVGVEMTIEEFELAEAFATRFIKLSVFDRIALSIAKRRSITLLTGDGALRKAAVEEGVNVIGTIGILDRLYSEGRIDADEYGYCLIELQNRNGREVRLPKYEISARLQKLR